MRYLVLFVLSIFGAGCNPVGAVEGMALKFSAYASAPVVVTHFAIEMPLGKIHPEVVGGRADISWPRDSGSTASVSAPIDAGNDGIWHLSAQWVELPTDRAWRAEVDIPVEKLTLTSVGRYRLNVIFGPNGLLMIASDKPGNKLSDKIDIVRACGHRVPGADEAMRLKGGDFPRIPYVMKNVASVKNPECSFPKR